ncbi:MAG: ABC transporter permease [Acidobacteria bacterium]|nr:ABC transporter permease [Acidobacteriota bacterium]
MGAFARDLRYALRQLKKAPGFAIVVVVMLALGIGANTAVFSVMNAVLMQLLPVSRPHGLYYVRMANGEGQAPGAGNTGDSSTSFSEVTFEALRQRTDVFEDLIGYVPLSFNGSVAIRHGDLPEEAEGEEVSGNFFSGLSARMGQGRGFTYQDEKDHTQIAVISYEFWTRSFARDPNVVGKTMYVKGVPLTIVGVTARGFKGIEPAVSADFWIPLQNRPELNAWGTPAGNDTLYGSPKWWCLRLMARLRPGVTPIQAQQALVGTFGGVVKQTVGTVDEKQWKPLLDFVEAKGISGYNSDMRTPVEILMGLVGLVLLIACTNVVMMVQARNTAREYEFSLRMAIGAGRASIFRQLLCESVLLVAVGASAGWLFALSATQMLASWSGVETGLSPDRTVLLFTIAISAVAALAFGLFPLWSASRVPVAGVLRSASATSTATRSRLTGARVTLSAQIAVCLVLLVSAGLLLRTLRNYANENLGVETQGLLVFGVTPQRGVDEHAFYRRLLDRIGQIPSVESVSLAENRPGSGWSDNNDLVIDGVEKQDAILRSNNVGPDFFRTMGVPILAGRDIAVSDTETTQRVAVVNETFVKKFLTQTNPIGHALGRKNPFTIVGVARDSKYTSVDEEPRPMAFYGAMQFKAMGNLHVEVHTRGDATAMLPAIRKAVSAMYPDVPLEQPMTQAAQFEKSYRQQRMFAALGGFFGVLAALLVATGLYGAHSFRVSRRSTEIGVRMALGATRGQVLIMFLKESLWVLVFGVIAGIPLTLLAIRPLKSMLYQMSPFDVTSFVIAIAAISAVSAGAVLLPARRAASVDPMRALRTE